MIDSGTVNKILDVSNIVEVVGDFVALKKRGVNYLGNCPFHKEKTPSFTVSQAKGIYKCFGCGAAGNSVKFIMDHESLSYVEALKYLAKKYNIPIVEKELTAEDIQQRNVTESLLIVNNYAQKYFTDNLMKHIEGKSVGLSYFYERGFTDATLEKFQLGYCLSERDGFSQAAIKAGYKPEYLTQTGLSIEKDGRYFDRFRERVIFPIHNIAGKVIAFGGRILKKDVNAAKYLNSPESEIYHKSKVLYGIFFAKKSITQNDKCFLVEGYTDVISMHQAGIENVVASSGTALSEDQIRLIKRFTNNLTILFDGDAAGIKASLRGIDMVLEQGLNVKVLLLPDGEDPDSFSRKMSSTQFDEYIKKNETDFVAFKTKLLIDEAKNDPIKKAALITDIIQSICVIPDPIIRSVYVKECSTILNVDEQVLQTEINKRRRKEVENKSNPEFRKAEAEQSPQPETPKKDEFVDARYKNDVHEREIIRLLLSYGDAEFFSEEIEDEFGDITKNTTSVKQFIINEIEADELKFANPIYQEIYDEFKTNLDKGNDLSQRHFSNHSNANIAKTTIDITSQRYELSKIWEKHETYVETEDMILKKVVNQMVLSFKNQYVLEMLKDLNDKMKVVRETNDVDQMMSIQIEYMNLLKLKAEWAKTLGERIIINTAR